MKELNELEKNYNAQKNRGRWKAQERVYSLKENLKKQDVMNLVLAVVGKNI
jgi:hypothetical protein